MDVSYRADGQMKFTPSMLIGAPTGAVIIFQNSKHLPFDLYETQFDHVKDACASYKRITSSGDTHISMLDPPSKQVSKQVARFACGNAEVPCICDKDSLFFINPISDVIQTTAHPRTINPGPLSVTTWRPLSSTAAITDSGRSISPGFFIHKPKEIATDLLASC